jgi:hypothetical protein
MLDAIFHDQPATRSLWTDLIGLVSLLGIGAALVLFGSVLG